MSYEIGDRYTTVKELYNGETIKVEMVVEEVIDGEEGSKRTVSRMVEDDRQRVKNKLEEIGLPEDTPS